MENQTNLFKGELMEELIRNYFISLGYFVVRGIYGQQDQIFSEKQLIDMKKIVDKENFKMIDNCSH